MRKIKTFLKLILIFLILFFIVLLILFFNPKSTINLVDKIFLKDYDVVFSDIKFNKSFLTPEFSIKDFSLENINNVQLFEIKQVEASIDVVKLITRQELSFVKLYINNFSNSLSEDSQKNQFKTSQKISGKNLIIASDDFNFRSDLFALKSLNNNIMLIFHNGSINSNKFLNLKAVKLANKVQYLFETNLTKKILEDLDFYSSKNQINGRITSKGVLNLKSNDIVSLYKVNIDNSKISLGDENSLNNLNGILYSNLNKDLSGFFKGNISNSKKFLLENEQIISSIFYNDESKVTNIFSSLSLDLGLLNQNSFLKINGLEKFDSNLEIKKDKLSLILSSKMKNTSIISEYSFLNKEIGSTSETKITIEDLSDVSYFVTNKNYNFYLYNNSGYFNYGRYFKNPSKNEISDNKFTILLDIDKFHFNQKLSSNSNSFSSLETLKIRAEDFHIYDNHFRNQIIDARFNKEIIIRLFGDSINGKILIKNNNDYDIFIENSSFAINETSNSGNFLDNSSLRFFGKNFNFNGNDYENVRLEINNRKNILHISKINIDGDSFKFSGEDRDEKGEILIDNIDNKYSIKGKLYIKKDFYYKDFFLNMDFDELDSTLNFQWEDFSKLKGIDGVASFRFKSLSLNRDSDGFSFLRALKIFNLDALVENIDESKRFERYKFNWLEGNVTINKNALEIIDQLVVDTDDAKLYWSGSIYKNELDIINDLDLDLGVRIKVAENIPWYAAIAGGIPAAASSILIQNIFEDELNDASTIYFKTYGTVKKPILKRLN